MACGLVYVVIYVVIRYKLNNFLRFVAQELKFVYICRR